MKTNDKTIKPTPAPKPVKIVTDDEFNAAMRVINDYRRMKIAEQQGERKGQRFASAKFPRDKVTVTKGTLLMDAITTAKMRVSLRLFNLLAVNEITTVEQMVAMNADDLPTLKNPYKLTIDKRVVDELKSLQSIFTVT